MSTLATKYRPRTFKEVVCQDNIKKVLTNQLDTGEVKQAYLFCGSAGTGKTTSARIFANEVNGGKGKPIEGGDKHVIPYTDLSQNVINDDTKTDEQ